MLKKAFKEDFNITQLDLFEILNQMGEWCYIRNKHYEVVYQNPSMKRDLGIWEGRKCYEMIYGALAPCPWCDNEYWLSGKSLKRHFRVKNADKIITSTFIDLSFVGADDGLLVISHDVSDLIKDIELKAEKEKVYRNLFEHLPCGVYVSTSSGKFLEVNQALVNMLGYSSKEELLSIDITKDLYVDPHERKIFQGIVEAKGFVDGYELNFKKKDGSIINVILSSYVTEKTANGEKTYQGIILDVTHIKEIEKKLFARDLFMKNVINSSADAIIVVNLAGNILLLNPSAYELLSIPADFPKGELTIIRFMKKEDRKRILSSLAAQNSQGRLGPLRVELFDLRGQSVPVELTASLVSLETGEKGCMAILRDLRPSLELQQTLERTKTQAALSEKMASIGRLAAGVAHEINNPLGAILMQAYLALEKMPQDSSAAPHIQKVIKQAERCAGIVKKLLEFAREREPKQTSLNVGHVINQVLDFFEHHPLFHNISITKHIPEDLPSIKGDLTQLQEVFLNIVVNAAEAMEGKGELIIEAKQTNGYVEVHISDTGPGVPDSLKERIFEPFFTTKGDKNGTGLGLAVSHGIVTAHGGEILVGDRPGGGACFSVRFPVAVDA